MWIINSIFGAIVDLALFPFREMSPMIGLTCFSLAAGVGMLYVFKWTSDQKGLEDVKRKMHAGIFEIRLFSDDIRAIFTAQRDIFRYNFVYLRLALAPLLWMIIPFVLMVAQLQLHYGYEGLMVGEPVIVKVAMSGERAVYNGLGAEGGVGSSVVELEVPDGLRLETPRLTIRSLNQAEWRLVADEPGSYELGIRVGDQVYSKSVEVSSQVVKRSPIRTDRFLDQLLYPGEPGFPSGAAVSAIEVLYPEREVNFFGWDTHWLVPFIIITIILAFALKKPLRVTF
tara:strand:- start:194 stop:1045 length:852 start_codon:yes stop_codon:yes gene_type:complete